MLISLRGASLRPPRLSPARPLPLPRPSLLVPSQCLALRQHLRHGSTKRKKRSKSGEFIEKESDRRLRLKRKSEKEADKRRKKLEKLEAARKSKFVLPVYPLRPDAVPFGSAMGVLRGWSAKQAIFVRSSAAPWVPETKVVAMVRVVPNDHQPKPVKGRVKFPHPVVVASKETKTETIAAIVDGDEETQAAGAAGMIVGGIDYLENIVKWVSEAHPLPFDILLATPNTVSWFRQHGRVLGPKGLMPSEKRGTVVSDFSTYATRVEKGIELKLDSEAKSKKGAMARIVVGKLKQDNHQIQANIKALIRDIHKFSSGTQIPLELSLYTTIPPFIVHRHPHLTTQSTIHIPDVSKVQPPNTVYPPDRAGFLSNASFIIPIASFPGVGHSHNLQPKRLDKRFVADAEWAPAQGLELQLAKFKAGIRDLEKKKLVYKWHINRTEEEKQRELQSGFRRSGGTVLPYSREVQKSENKLLL